ncbi:unnamed protein product [Symbiodinium microadriaticum]|nr:unnamed protein product [Symbiodinium microadriaticum]
MMDDAPDAARAPFMLEDAPAARRPSRARLAARFLAWGRLEPNSGHDEGTTGKPRPPQRRGSVITCSDDFTGHSGDQRHVVQRSLEWTASADHLLVVDLWGGGGGGTGSVIKRQQTKDIEVTVNVTGFRGQFRAPSGVYHLDADSAGNVRYVSPGDVYHLGRGDNCVNAETPCWGIRLNPEHFKSSNIQRPILTPVAELDWPSHELPLGRRDWSFFDTWTGRYGGQGRTQGLVEVKRLATSYGVCGGSGGGGAHARALVEVRAGRTYRIEAGRGGRSGAGGRGAERGHSSRMLEKSDLGEWHVLAEAGGGVGAGSFDDKSQFSPGGQGGVAPNLKAHTSTASGHQGQPSRSRLQFSETILSPDALQTLPHRLYDDSMDLTCRNAQNPTSSLVTASSYVCRDPVPRDYDRTLPPVCMVQNARRPVAQNVDWDYFVSCDVRCVGTEWPSSPSGGSAAMATGLAEQMRAGQGGNGSCPSKRASSSKASLENRPGNDGKDGLGIVRHCRREGAYTLALQRCEGSSSWTIHGLWPRGVRDCANTALDVSTLSGLQPQLVSQWPSCLPSSEAEAFWQHEWQKHGTCFSSSPVHYFQLTLRLFDRLTEEFELCGGETV